jgi:hypothetical protein
VEFPTDSAWTALKPLKCSGPRASGGLAANRISVGRLLLSAAAFPDPPDGFLSSMKALTIRDEPLYSSFKQTLNSPTPTPRMRAR